MDIYEGRSTGFTREKPQNCSYGPPVARLTIKVANAPNVPKSTAQMVKEAPSFRKLPKSAQNKLRNQNFVNMYDMIRRHYHI